MSLELRPAGPQLPGILVRRTVPKLLGIVNPRRAERLLWAAAALLLIAAVGVAAWAVAASPEVEVADIRTAAATRPADGTTADVPEVAWATPLRRPLVDPPPVTIALPDTQQIAGLGVQLAGTLVEDGDGARSKAVLVAGGETVLRGVGQEVAGAKVVAVGEGRATLLHRGEQVELVVADDEDAEAE